MAKAGVKGMGPRPKDIHIINHHRLRCFRTKHVKRKGEGGGLDKINRGRGWDLLDEPLNREYLTRLDAPGVVLPIIVKQPCKHGDLAASTPCALPRSYLS